MECIISAEMKACKKPGEKIVWDYCRWYYNQFDARTCPSEYMQTILASQQIKADVYPNGIDLERFERAGKKETQAFLKSHELEKNKVVLFVGRVVKEKNLDIFIDSAPAILKSVPDFKFVIIGKGPAEDYYKTKIKEKGVRTASNSSAMSPMRTCRFAYSSASAFAFASFFDTQGLVAVEALACGTPIVGAKTLSDGTH